MVARKEDKGKLRYDLIPPQALQLLAEVYTHGAQKYGDHNYLEGDGLDRSRIVGGIKRHIESYLMGMDMDEEGQHNLAAAAWGCFTLIVYDIAGKGKDDLVGTLINKSEKDPECRIVRETARCAEPGLRHRIEEPYYRQMKTILRTAPDADVK